MALSFVSIWWWRHGGKESVALALQPGFEVRQIDLQEKTITVTRVNDTYVVGCENSCGMFVAGKTYAMVDRGGVLEYRTQGQRIMLPVLKEHIEFETPPGGHG